MVPQAATLAREADLPRVGGVDSLKVGRQARWAAFIAAIVAALGVAAVMGGAYFRDDLPLVLLLAAICAALAAGGVLLISRWPALRSMLRPNIAVLGDVQMAADQVARLGQSPRGVLVGLFRARDSVEAALEECGLIPAIVAGQVDRVAVLLPPSETGAADRIAARLATLSVDVLIYSALGNEAAAGTPVPARVVSQPISAWGRMSKDAEDRVLGAVALVLFLPLLLVVGLAVKLTSPGPVFFRQKRHGFRGREILVYKFRSMYVNASDFGGRNQTKRGDPRITPIGRFLRASSLDELPQLINVIRGEMSLVGPRPHPVDMRTDGLLCQDIVEDYDSRHRVRPGITGWAQINGYRGATTTREQVEGRVRLDNDYINNWSLIFDFRIMMLTTVRLFADENAY